MTWVRGAHVTGPLENGAEVKPIKEGPIQDPIAPIAPKAIPTVSAPPQSQIERPTIIVEKPPGVDSGESTKPTVDPQTQHSLASLMANFIIGKFKDILSKPPKSGDQPEIIET